MTNENECLIVCLLDRSGSMSTIKDDTEGAFNAFIEEQRAVDANRALVSLYQFDHNFGGEHVETVYERQPISQVPKLAIAPRGTTPLNDALGLTIVRVGEQLAALPEDRRPGQVIFVVMTDGHENASEEYTNQQVKDLVTAQTEQWNWEFVFLGAGVDAFSIAGGYGIKRDQTYSVAASGAGVRAGYRGVTETVSNLRNEGGNA